MSNKTKFELPDTPETKATFTADEVRAFIAGAYAAERRALYLQKMASRSPNHRLDDRGREVLSSRSMVADVDMAPLSAKANLGRFVKSQELYGDDGYDTDDSIDNDRHFDDLDRSENPPSPHELRSQRLVKKLDNARTALQKGVDERRSEGAISPPETKTADPEGQPAPKGAQS